MEVKTRYLREGDVEHLVANLRQADRDEIEAGTGGSVEDALIESIKLSSVSLVLEVGGEMGCIFGAAPLTGLLGSIGSPWMLSTGAMDRNPRVLIEWGPLYRDAMLGLYPHLMNYVDARNRRSIRWLKWLGFQFHDARPHGPAGMPFHLFELRK